MREIALGVALGYFIVIFVAGVGYILSMLLDALQKRIESSKQTPLKTFLVYYGSDFGLAQIRASSFESLYNQLFPILNSFDYWVIYEVKDPYNAETWIYVGSSIDTLPF